MLQTFHAKRIREALHLYLLVKYYVLLKIKRDRGSSRCPPVLSFKYASVSRFKYSLSLASSSMDVDTVKLARALASPDASVRAATAQDILAVLTSLSEPLLPSSSSSTSSTSSASLKMEKEKEESLLPLLKLWKALHYCLWLSDKVATQNEIAAVLAEGLRVTSAPVAFLTAFCRTLLREWTNLDQFRVDKFYVLTRCMIRELLRKGLLLLPSDGSLLLKQLLQVIHDEILLKTPNGPRLHLADIFLDELLQVLQEEEGIKLSAPLLMDLLAPFLFLLPSCRDAAVLNRVALNVMEGVIEKLCREEEKSLKKEEDNAEEEKKKKTLLLSPAMRQVILETVQAAVFDLASGEETLEGNRQRLYDLHKVFQRATKKKHINVADIPLLMEEEVKKSSSKQATESKTKETPHEAPPTATTATATPLDEKKNEEESIQRSNAQSQSATEAPAVAPVNLKKKKNKMSDTTPLLAAAASDAVELKKKKKEASESTVSQSVDVPEVPIVTSSPDFVSARKFTKPMNGYVFTTGSQGLGYYKDKKGSSAKPGKLKPASAPVSSSSSQQQQQSKSVRFGKVKAKEYADSVESLKRSSLSLSSSATSVSTSVKGVLKVSSSTSAASAIGVKRNTTKLGSAAGGLPLKKKKNL